MHKLIKPVIALALIFLQLNCIQNENTIAIGKYENKVSYFDLFYTKLLSSERIIIPVCSLEIMSNGQFILAYCSPDSIIGDWKSEKGDLVLYFDSLFCPFPELLKLSSRSSLKGEVLCEQKIFLYNFQKVR